MHWLNGHRLSGSTGTFDLSDRGLLLGDGVFDTSFVLNGEVVFKDRHLQRLFASCDVLGLEVDPPAITSQVEMAASDVKIGALRVTITRGPGPRGLLPQPRTTSTILIATSEGQPTALWQPVRAKLSPTLRNETSVTSTHKCLGYLDAIQALRAATKEDFDEAVFLNTKGHVTCCTAGNLFALSDKTLMTPPVEDGVLPGVTRAIIMELSNRVGLSVAETSIDVYELVAADAVFMTNSLRLISPVVSLGSEKLSARGYSTLENLARYLSQHIKDLYGSSILRDHFSAGWLSSG